MSRTRTYIQAHTSHTHKYPPPLQTSCFLAVRDAHNCSFGAWLWRFAPGGRPVVGGWTDMAQVPAK